MTQEHDAAVAALEAAIQADSADRVRTVLAEHPELKAKLNDALPSYAFGETSLLAAGDNGNREMVDVLLAAGADVNQRSHWWAGSFGVLDQQRGLFDFFMARGARIDVNAAAKHGTFDVVRQLIADDPSLVRARAGDGQTALHVAASVEIAAFLVDNGADIDALDVDHESTPAQYQIGDHKDVVRFLVSRGCRTDILMVSALGDIALARKLLDADPAVAGTAVNSTWFPMKDPRAGGTIYNWTLGWHKTPHVIALECGHADVFDLLMSRSADAVKLVQACALGDAAMFEALIAAHPNLIDTLTDDQRARLPIAADTGNVAAVRMMLAAGWPVDARHPNGATALHFAAWEGNVDMVREILRYKPRLDLRDGRYDGTPLDWAEYGSRHGPRCNTPEIAAVIEALTDAGAP
jgi:ankyrin repeat protein